MRGVLHRIAQRIPPAPPMPAAIAMADAGEPVFGIEIEPLVPLPVVIGAGGFVANKRRVAICQMNPPPADVATEEGDVSAGFDKRLDVASHRLAPIFVMTSAQE